MPPIPTDAFLTSFSVTQIPFSIASSIEPELVAIFTAASQENFPNGQVAMKRGFSTFDTLPQRVFGEGLGE
jgi:hypothetical protein